MLSINNLIFHYENGFSIKVGNLFVNRGEMVFLSGESGSGKSTLLNIIAGILDYKSGSVTVMGQELKYLTSFQRDKFRGENIGFIFQQFNLIPYLSVVDNVLLPCKLFNKKSDLLETLIERTALPKECLDKRVDELSIGQQQRVACIRALIGRPSLVIADEPTSALDDDKQNAFLKLLIECCKDINSTLIFVSHNKNLSRLFDRIVEIKNGILS
ncbi:MAG: ABC transporter ATP-binding protein [Rickettsiales bacterium]|jgi:putative ABC transport system ATP-binding protein|nr:ABC transporter ATP-binding protein [Rickettsiales bacterium]